MNNLNTVMYGPWWSHVDSFVHNEHVHVIHYEDLIEVKFKIERLF